MKQTVFIKTSTVYTPRTGGLIPKILPQRRSLFFGAVDFHHCCAFTVDFEIYAFPLCVGPVGMRLDFVCCVLCVCPVLETLRFSGKIHIWRLYLYCIGDFWDFRKKSMYGFPLCVSVLGTWFYNIKSLHEFPSVCELYAGRLIILQKFQYWNTYLNAVNKMAVFWSCISLNKRFWAKFCFWNLQKSFC